MKKLLSQIVSLGVLLGSAHCLAMGPELASRERPWAVGTLALEDLSVMAFADVARYAGEAELVLPYVAERRQRALYQKMAERGTTVTNIRNRCEEDNLGAPQAVGRIMWLARCERGFIIREVSRVTAGDYSGEDAVVYFLQEYGIVKEGGRYVAKDVETGKRQFYPLVASPTASEAWTGPVEEVADCAGARSIPANYIWISDCLSSCYKPSMRLSFEGQSKGIRQALDEGAAVVDVLADDSTLEQPVSMAMPVDYFVASFKDTWHDIVTLRMLSGGVLEVTANHPLVDERGAIREAGTFAMGEALIRHNGELDPIVDIAFARWYGKVYNIQPLSQETLENIVIAEGYLSGSSWYQNDGGSERSRVLFRANIPDSALR